MGKIVSVQLEPLTFTKRFDVASAKIHACLHQHIQSHQRVDHRGPRAQGRDSRVLQPGFVFLATKGYFTECEVSTQQDGNLLEVVENCTLSFERVTMTYLKTLSAWAGDNMFRRCRSPARKTSLPNLSEVAPWTPPSCT
jgi:hypothetical protein